jgi:hypothetical protein
MKHTKTITITKGQLYQAHDGYPMTLSADFTDIIWQYLQDIVKEDEENQYRKEQHENALRTQEESSLVPHSWTSE